MTTAAVPANIQRGQRKILFEVLASVYPKCLSLNQIGAKCGLPYVETFRNPGTDVHDSLLYQLNRIAEAELC
jgi:hypothetical protein